MLTFIAVIDKLLFHNSILVDLKQNLNLEILIAVCERFWDKLQKYSFKLLLKLK